MITEHVLSTSSSCLKSYERRWLPRVLLDLSHRRWLLPQGGGCSILRGLAGLVDLSALVGQSGAPWLPRIEAGCSIRLARESNLGGFLIVPNWGEPPNPGKMFNLLLLLLASPSLWRSLILSPVGCLFGLLNWRCVRCHVSV